MYMCWQMAEVSVDMQCKNVWISSNVGTDGWVDVCGATAP